jgi:hypothetical protein
MKPKPKLLWYLTLPPLVVLLRDIAAAIGLLSREPGLSDRDVFIYKLAILPGSLWVGSSAALMINLTLAVLLGFVSYLVVRKNRSLA